MIWLVHLTMDHPGKLGVGVFEFLRVSSLTEPAFTKSLYDSWVARDVCGTPLRAFWPYVKEGQGAQRVKAEKPVEVAACWNGAIAMPAKPYIRQHAAPQLTARGWRMMDNGKRRYSTTGDQTC